MTKEKAIEILEKAAEFIEHAIRLDRESGGMFCLGTDTIREISVSASRWPELIGAIQPVITYDATWGDQKLNYTKASFKMQLLGKEYEVFALFWRGKRND